MTHQSSLPLLAIVLGSGGHTSELIKIIKESNENIPNAVDHLLIYSEGDSLSLSKYKNAFGVDAAVVKRIPRARRVGQSYFTSIFTTIYSLIASIFILFKFNPKIVNCANICQ